MLALQPTKLTLFSLPSTSRVCSWSTVIATGAHGSLIVIRAAKLAAHFWLPQRNVGPIGGREDGSLELSTRWM